MTYTREEVATLLSVGGKPEVLGGNGDPVVWHFGWIPFALRSQAQALAAVVAEATAPPRFAIRGNQRSDAEKVCLTDLWKHPETVQALGFAYPGTHQLTGSCVGAGGGNGLFSLIAADAIMRRDPARIVVPFWLLPYGRSRYYMGDRSPGEGSLGGTFAKAVREDGTLDAKAAGLPPFTNEDGLVWGSRVEYSWSDGDAEQTMRLLPESRKHLVQSTAACKSADDVRDAIRNYYPVTIASSWGGLMKCPTQGNPPVLMSRRTGSWGHQMCLAPDTRVSLLDGTEQTLKELADSGGKVWVYSYDHATGKVVPKETEAKMTRPSSPEGMVRVSLDNGESVTATPDHRFLLRDGMWREARHLQPGDSLMPLYRRYSTKEDCPVRVGYEMVQDPVDGHWVFTHRRVTEEVDLIGLRYKEGTATEVTNPGPPMAYVHHRDFNRRNNDPRNLARMLKREHWQLHADHADPSWMWKARQDAAYCERQAIAARKAMLKLRQDPAFLAKLSEAASDNMQRLNADPEFQERRDAATRKMLAKRFADPAEREKARHRFVERKKNPEFRRKQAEAVKKVGATEEFRRKAREAARKRAADPEYRRKLSEAALRREARKRTVAPSNHKVASILHLPGETGPTYCLKVDGTHNFAVSAGVFVHNSVQAWWNHPSEGEIFWIHNQWGLETHGRCPSGMPGGGFWVKKTEIDWITRTGEVFAFSQFQDFPADWFLIEV